MRLNIYEITLTSELINNTTLIYSFLFDCECALFFIDITSNNSFLLVKSLFDSVNFGFYPFIKKIIVLNKTDLEDQRSLNYLEYTDFLYTYKILDLDSEEISLETKANFDKLINKINIGITQNQNQLPINCIYQLDSNSNLANAQSTITVILLGDSSVGKSCFLGRYFHNQFSEIFLTTTGLDKQIKALKINNVIYKLCMLDTAGQERYKSLPKRYYQNADGILLLYDVNNIDSFNNINYWIKNIKDYSKNDKLVLYLIGNKIDLPNRVVEKEAAEELANSFEINYYEVSCKINMNINEVVSRMIIQCYMKINNLSDQNSLSRSVTDLTNSPKKTNNTGGCCGGKKPPEETKNTSKETPKMRESLETISSEGG